MTFSGIPVSTDRHNEDAIICAIGSDGSPAAVALACREAARTSARLHLVHVTTDPHGRTTDDLLLDVMVSVRSSYPAIAVTRDVVEGAWIAAGLAGLGRARYVVIERTRKGRVHRVLSGSTANGVALAVAAPVLSVPPGWRGDEARPAVVTVAVQDAEDVPRLVALAASEADARGLDLVVLHAATDEDGTAPVERHDWLDRAHLQLDAPVRDAVADRPDLKVRVEVTSDRPVDAVVGASASSTLLVIGRRHHEHAWGTHLGPVARRALLDAACPVLLAPEDATASASTHDTDEVTTDTHPPVPGDVVVAVGEDDAAGAVRFAVAEAVARGVGVHLVHVLQVPATDGASSAEVWRDALAHGASILDRAHTQARDAGGPDLALNRRLVERGPVVRSVVTVGAAASAIVVQHRRLGPVQRLTTWSVTNGLAARTDVPVIAVPADWATGPERVGCVVVGLQDLSDLDDVLPVALDEAARRGLPLRVVHAGRLSAREDEEMVRAIETVRGERPDVPIRRVFEDRYPVDLLIGAVTTAELVVVGRRRRGLSRRSHLGPVARDVLDRSPFPVLLAPPGR